MDPIRILIADDHTLFREGVPAILKAVGDLKSLVKPLPVGKQSNWFWLRCRILS